MDIHDLILGREIIKPIENIIDYFRGEAITIPPMVGALRANTRLDMADVIAEVHAPDNLIHANSEIYYSSRNAVYILETNALSNKSRLVKTFDAEITCMAAHPYQGYALGLETGEIFVCQENNEQKIKSVGPNHLKCPTAMVFLDQDRLIICQGSNHVSPLNSIHDLMLSGSNGSVWEINLTSAVATLIVDNLAFPYGVMLGANDSELYISECWAHRIIKISLKNSAQIDTILTDLPGYPARLVAGLHGKAWLCLFAPRNRLIEFVLKERELCSQMIETIDLEYWVAPKLSSNNSFMEPLQKGGVKTMGIHKPWAPCFSYGLLVHLDESFQPVESLHSRANGSCHGITSVCQIENQIWITSKGNHKILNVDLVSDKLSS